MARFVEITEDGEIRAPRVHQYRDGLIAVDECHWAMVWELSREGVEVPQHLIDYSCVPSTSTIDELNWLWLN